MRLRTPSRHCLSRSEVHSFQLPQRVQILPTSTLQQPLGSDAVADGQSLRALFLLCSRGVLKKPNVELTGAARLYRAASSDRRERG